MFGDIYAHFHCTFTETAILVCFWQKSDPVIHSGDLIVL